MADLRSRALHRTASPAAAKPAACIAAVDSSALGAHKQPPENAVGLRTCVAWLGGFLPVTVLNLILPAVAFYRGDIKIPNVLISDVMASHPLYSAIYSWVFSVNMLCACFVMRELSMVWSRKIPELAPNIARFVAILYGICAPSLFGVVSFQYKQDIDIFTSPLDSDFCFWLVHAIFAAMFFLAALAMAIIYGWRLGPVLMKKDLVHPADRFWRTLAVNGILVFTAAGTIVRCFHLHNATAHWGIVLVVVEVVLIQLMQVGLFIGMSRDMMNLDAIDPIFHLSDLLC